MMIFQEQVPPIDTDSIYIEKNAIGYSGIFVGFFWKAPIADEEAAQLQATVSRESEAAVDSLNRRWQANRRKGIKQVPNIERGDYTPQGVVMPLLHVLWGSTEWAFFYAHKKRHTIHGHQFNGHGKVCGDIVIPVFDERELLEIRFTTTGGHVEFFAQHQNVAEYLITHKYT